MSNMSVPDHMVVEKHTVKQVAVISRNSDDFDIDKLYRDGGFLIKAADVEEVRMREVKTTTLRRRKVNGR